MRSLGLAGSGKPKVRAGDMERALALITELGGDKKSREYLADLVAAEAEADKARTVAEAAAAEAKRRDATAREAEDRARSQRDALATETAEAERRLTAERTELARENVLAKELEEAVDAKLSDLTHREEAIRRAFIAYEGG